MEQGFPGRKREEELNGVQAANREHGRAGWGGGRGELRVFGGGAPLSRFARGGTHGISQLTTQHVLTCDGHGGAGGCRQAGPRVLCFDALNSHGCWEPSGSEPSPLPSLRDPRPQGDLSPPVHSPASFWPAQ